SHNKSIEIYEYPGTKRGFASPNYDQISQEISFKSDLAHTRSLSILRKVIGPYRNLSDLWETHMKHEFTSKDVQKTMSTMVNLLTDDAYVNHVPTMIGGGVEHERLAQF
ncbi:11203_t:CDS:2, partial [Dentiscutata erythropus]